MSDAPKDLDAALKLITSLRWELRDAKANAAKWQAKAEQAEARLAKTRS